MAEMNQPDLSIIIVTWNSEEEIIECLHSIYLTKYSELAGKVETIVVDNDSQDRTVSAVNNFKKVNNFDIKIKEFKCVFDFHIFFFIFNIFLQIDFL